MIQATIEIRDEDNNDKIPHESISNSAESIVDVDPPISCGTRFKRAAKQFFTESDPDVWKLDKSMFPVTLRFREDKIESAYIWHLNKRYYIANRYLAWFMAALSVAFIIHNWALESRNRFLAYMILNITMFLPMIVCALITYVRLGDRYFVYRYMHIVMSLCMFITSFAWIFGQPLVFLIFGDPLVLDPIHGLLMFAIFNLSMTTVRLSIISTSILMAVQLLLCVIGLIIRSKSLWNDFFAFAFNIYYPLVVAWLFAWLTSWSREKMMRQSFLVRHFQREEALIIQRSRIKLEITEAGMKVLKKHNSKAATDALDLDRVSIYSNASSTPSTLCEVRRSHGVSQFGAPSQWISLLSFSRPVRTLPSLERITSMFSPSRPESPTSPKDGELEIIDEEVPKEDKEAEAEQKMFFEIMGELPTWIMSLPGVIQSRMDQRGFRKKIKNFCRRYICMDSGNVELESRFQEVFII